MSQFWLKLELKPNSTSCVSISPIDSKMSLETPGIRTESGTRSSRNLQKQDLTMTSVLAQLLLGLWLPNRRGGGRDRCWSRRKPKCPTDRLLGKYTRSFESRQSAEQSLLAFDVPSEGPEMTGGGNHRRFARPRCAGSRASSYA
jgi:hypothetical protein